MGDVLTVMETVFPKASGPAVYTWKARSGEEWVTSQGAAVDGATGTFATPGEARTDLTGWLLERKCFSRPMPEEVLILRAQPEVYAVIHVD